jgi:hypothetical protein
VGGQTVPRYPLMGGPLPTGGIEGFGKWPPEVEPAMGVLPEDFSDQAWDGLGYWYPVAILFLGPGLSHLAAAIHALRFRAVRFRVRNFGAVIRKTRTANPKQAD